MENLENPLETNRSTGHIAPKSANVDIKLDQTRLINFFSRFGGNPQTRKTFCVQLPQTTLLRQTRESNYT